MSAPNVVRDVLAFAEKLRAAADVVERADSLEQAIRESEERLKALRAAEKVVKTEVEANRERAHQAEEGAKAQAKAILDAAYAEAGKKRAETAAACAAQLAEAAEALAEVDKEHKRRSDECDRLADEEAKIGQCVAALRADLAALKLRLG